MKTANPETRLCPTCRELGRRRELPPGQVHVHDLDPGDPFRLPMTDRVSRVVEIGAGRAEVESFEPAEDAVEFETADGRSVSFERSSSATRPVSPTMLVEPLGAGAGR